MNGKKYNPLLPLDSVLIGDVMDFLPGWEAESVDMIYADPDYNVGVTYNGKRYRKSFDEYISWCCLWASQCYRLLKPTGNFFIINYPKNNAYLRVCLLDKLFYEVYEYVWIYNTNIGHSPRRFTTAHRTILHCVKSKHNAFYKDQVAVPYQNPTDRRIKANLAAGSKGRMPYSWFYFDLVKNVSKEKTIHSCQIPEKLAEMLILSCTKPGDIVLVLFGGSGSEVVKAKELGRHYLTVEIDPKYARMIMDRLENGKLGEEYRPELSRARTAKRLSEKRQLQIDSHPTSQVMVESE